MNGIPYTNIPEFDSMRELEIQYKSSREALFVHDLDCGKILYVNEAMLNMYGMTREEAMQIGLEDISAGDTPHTVEKVFELFSKVKELGQISFEWHDRRKNGRLFWTENIMKLVKIGGQTNILVLSSDITIRKKKQLQLQSTVRENTQEITMLNEKLTLANEELKIINEELENYKAQLEDLVTIRTQELRKSEEKFSSVFHFSPCFIFVRTAARGTIVEVNEAFTRKFGYTTEELTGRSLLSFNIIEKESYAKINNLIKEKGYYKNLEIKLITKEKEVLFCLASGEKVKLGQHLFIIETIRDITDLKKAEESLRKSERILMESERKYLQIFNAANEAILIHHAQSGAIVDANQAALDLFGISHREIFMQGPINPDAFNPGFDAVSFRNNFQKALEKSNVVFERQFSRKNGNNFWAEVSLKSSEIGGDLKVISVLRDISERKMVEKALKISESKFRNIFNNSSDAIIIVGNNHYILEINDVFHKLTGYTTEEIGRMKMTDIITDTYLPDFVDKLFRLFQHENLPAIECEIRTKSRLSTPVEINSKLIEFEGEKALVSTIRDITERRQIETRILDTIISTEEKEREKFARNLHDELGPLLSSIKMYVNSLSSGMEEKKHEFIMLQLKQILTEVIQSTKDLSNDLSPHILMNYGLVAALEWFINQIKPYMSITLESNLKDTRYGSFVELAIYRIIKELINNTIKHAKARSVRIKLHLILGSIRLVYADNGAGFPGNWQDNFEFLGMGMSNIMSRCRSLNAVSKFYNHTPHGMSFEMEVPVT